MRYFVLYTHTPTRPEALYDWHRGLGRRFQSKPAWHNHDPQTGRALHRYPLIQYKILNGHFAIVGLDSTQADLFELAAALPLGFWIKGRYQQLTFNKVVEYKVGLQQTADTYGYQLDNWIPMNSDQFQQYKSLCAQLQLDKGQPMIEHPELLHFFEGLLREKLERFLADRHPASTAFPLHIELISKKIQHAQTIFYKGTHVSMLKGVQLRMNFKWPLHLGLGIGAAIGYGMFKPLQ